MDDPRTTYTMRLDVYPYRHWWNRRYRAMWIQNWYWRTTNVDEHWSFTKRAALRWLKSWERSRLRTEARHDAYYYQEEVAL